jgi:BirA family biotin operon repressor/biotin-[acetyl-CoA-carboxylase] ligase
MDFDAEALRLRLAGRRIGCRLHFMPTVDSTNRVALGFAQEGAPEGTVVLADRQTAGRGRMDRRWQSPPDCNLYLSLLLRPVIAPADAPQITLVAGVAVAETLSLLCPAGVVGLKWPNDVMIRGRKVCGILTEMRMAETAVEAIVVGIGLNVNMAEADFDPTLRDTATSLRRETGRTHSREEVAALLCERFERWYDIFRSQGFHPVREGWLARSDMPGKRVRIHFLKEAREGVVKGIDRDGALLLADDHGALRRITAGDASIVK